MLFTSLSFLFYFLPFSLVIYWLLKPNFQIYWLLFVSILFYAISDLEHTHLLLISLVVNFGFGWAINKYKKYDKWLLYSSLFFNFGALIYFKYFNFILESFGQFSAQKIILPIGISFLTFNIITYSVDIYRQKAKPFASFIDFATYITLFPHLIAGPIIEYKHIRDQILEVKKFNFDQVSAGIEIFILGFAKKILIANSMASVVDKVFTANTWNFGTAWIVMILYALQIYFDFSGYTDMAIGIAKMFGYNFPLNFNYPYISKTVQEFWQRWHITLGTWFKNYIYIPLGGSRVAPWRVYANLMIVFLLTGIWHGANTTFVLWGILNGLFICFEKLFLNKVFAKIPNIFSHAYLLVAVLCSWVLFRAENLNQARQLYASMLDFANSPSVFGFWNKYMNAENTTFLVFGLVFSTPIYQYIQKYLWVFKYLILAIIFAISLTYTISNSYNPFIYFKF